MKGSRNVLVCVSAFAILSCGGSNGAEAPDATALRDGDDVSVDAREEFVEGPADVTPDAQEPITDAAAETAETLDAKDETTDARDATLPPAHCDSVVWSKVPGSPSGYGIMGSGPFDLWMIARDQDAGPCNLAFYPGLDCRNGQLLHGDGITWSPGIITDAAGLGVFAGNTRALWVTAHDDVWISAFYNEVAHWDGTGWTTFSTQDNRIVDYFWGYATGELWAAREDGQYLSYWENDQLIKYTAGYGGVLAGGAPGDLWMAGYNGHPGLDGGTIYGNGFTHHAPPADLVNFDQTVLLSSLNCGAMDGGAPIWEAGWASATDDVWFVGDRAYHYDGASWTCVPTPTVAELHGIWGTSKTDVWAVGDSGTILHFDGTHWSSVPSPATGQLLSVWASGPCDVWAVGDAVYHGQPGPAAAPAEGGVDATTD